MKGEFFKGACIAYILLGSVFFPKSAWAEEPPGTMIYHDIKDFGEYYDSESAITYVFIKGTLSSCSDSTNICTITSSKTVPGCHVVIAAGYGFFTERYLTYCGTPTEAILQFRFSEFRQIQPEVLHLWEYSRSFFHHYICHKQTYQNILFR